MYLQSSAELYYNGLVGSPPKLYGILPGAFNPPTEAHLALARAALNVVDQVIFVLPRAMPHKDYSGVTFEQRLQLLEQATAGEPRFTVAQSAGGLFVDIGHELKATLPESAELHFLCGRDAAERIVNWDYGVPNAIETILRDFGILVAPRGGHYQIAEQHKSRIATLDLAPRYQAVSATSVREHIRDGKDWEYLVPLAIRERVRLLYTGGNGPNTR